MAELNGNVRVTSRHHDIQGELWLVAGMTILGIMSGEQSVWASTGAAAPLPEVEVGRAVMKTDDPVTGTQPALRSGQANQTPTTSPAPVSAQASPARTVPVSQSTGAWSEATPPDEAANATIDPERSTPIAVTKQPVTEKPDSAVEPRATAAPLATARQSVTPVAATPTVPSYDTTAPASRGLMGTSKWWIGPNKVLHLESGELANTNVKYDADGHVTDWGNVGWQRSPEAQGTGRLTLRISGKVIVNRDATGLFANLFLTDDSVQAGHVDTSKTVNMSHMFANDSDMTPLALDYDTSHVTDMSDMFGGDPSRGYGTIDLSKFDTSQVTTMAGMFAGLESLSSVNLASFDTRRVTDMSRMFEDDRNIEVLDLSNFDTSHVTTMFEMFANMVYTQKIVFDHFDTSQVTNMAGMFTFDQVLQDYNFTHFKTSRVTTMANMFQGTFVDNVYDPRHVKGLNTFDLHHVRDTTNMFADNYLPVGVLDQIQQLDFSNVQNMSGTFAHILNLPANFTPNIRVANVTNMHDLFANDDTLKQLDLSKLETGHVTDMSGMFSGDSQISRIILKDTRQVTNMEQMFSKITKPTNLEILGLTTASVTNMGGMFYGDTDLISLALTTFDTRQVTNMTQMFYGDNHLSTLDLSSFDMRSVHPTANIYGLDVEPAFPLKIFSLFQIVMPRAGGDPNSAFQLRRIRLNANSRLDFSDQFKTLDDLIDETKLPAGMTASDYVNSLLAMSGLKDPAALTVIQRAGLNTPSVLNGQWINERTGEALSTLELTARYSGKNAALATTDTWIWQTIIGHPVTKIASAQTTWDPAESFEKAVDFNNQALGLQALRVVVTHRGTTNVIPIKQLDLSRPGQYDVTFYHDETDGTRQTSGPLPLDIIANPAEISVHDVVVQLGQSWSPLENVDHVIDADGQTLPVDRLTVRQAVDPHYPDVYQVIYEFVDQLKTLHSAQSKVIVNGLLLKNQQLTIEAGESWDPKTNVQRAVDDHGKLITPEQLSVQLLNLAGDPVDPQQPGDYQLVYQFTDGHGRHQAVAQLHVSAKVVPDPNLAQLTLKHSNVVLWVGDVWDARANIEAVKDDNGQPVDPDRVTIIDPVDTARAGNYHVQYVFRDARGREHLQNALVTVRNDQAELVLKSALTTLRLGTKWDPKTNILRVTDSDGTAVDFQRVRLIGEWSSNQAGEGVVQYLFTDMRGHGHRAVTRIIVKADRSALVLKTTTIQIWPGARWVPRENIAYVWDADGRPVDPLSQSISIDDQTDVNRPGVYWTIYRFVDQWGKQLTASATVTVLPDQAVLKLKRTHLSLKVGTNWWAIDNVAKVVDVDGSPVAADRVTITDPVNRNQAGHYVVNYRFVDQRGHVHAVNATVTIVTDQKGSDRVPAPDRLKKVTCQNQGGSVSTGRGGSHASATADQSVPNNRRFAPVLPVGKRLAATTGNHGVLVKHPQRVPGTRELPATREKSATKLSAWGVLGLVMLMGRWLIRPFKKP